MFVEEILIRIRDALFPKVWNRHQSSFDLLDQWHIDFIASVGRHVEADRPLSTKQSLMILKLIEKVRPNLVQYGWATDSDIATMLTEPQFRHPPYESTNVPKEVRHIGDNLLAFRSKNNEVIRNKLKALCYPKLKKTHLTPIQLHPARFDWLYKVWIVPVYRFNAADILAFIASERFNIDESTAHYLRLVKHSFNQPSLFAVADEIILANVCDDPILAAWISEIAGGVTL